MHKGLAGCKNISSEEEAAKCTTDSLINSILILIVSSFYSGLLISQKLAVYFSYCYNFNRPTNGAWC